MRIAIRVSKDILNWSSENWDWLGEGEIPGDPIEDMVCQENKLSIFVLSDSDESLKRLAAAFTTTRHEFKNFEYVLFDFDLIHQVGIDYVECEADTCDKVVNSWHVDLYHLSAEKILSLTREIFHNCEQDIILKKEVQDLVMESIENQWIKVSEIKTSLRKKIDGLTNS